MSAGASSDRMATASELVIPIGPPEGDLARGPRGRSESASGGIGGRDRTRIGGLDGLRGLAALGVLVSHFTTFYEADYHFRGSPPFLFQDGMYGVQLFFFISGFVIFMTVEGSKRPVDFAISRFCRLYPAFWISLLICVVILATTDGPEPFLGWSRLVRRSLVEITMISGWLQVAPVSPVYWTLEVEMGFYAIIFALLVARRIDWAVPVLLALVAVGVVDGLYSRHHPNPVSPWLGTAHFLDNVHCMLIGVLLYKVRKGPRPLYFLIIIACFFVPFSQDPGHHEPWKEAIVKAVFAAVVLLATTGRIPPLNWKPFVFLGSISYSLYLNHWFLGTHIIYHAQGFGISPGGSILLATVASLALATLITKTFEEPASAALKRRFRRPA